MNIELQVKMLYENADKLDEAGFVADFYYIAKEYARQQNLQQTPCKTLLPPSGIKEYDELIKQFQNSEIDFLSLTCELWNKGYEAGKEYCLGGK